MTPLRCGGFVVRLDRDQADLARARALRARCFRADTGGADDDPHDHRCRHVLIEDAGTGQLAGCLRVMRLATGADVGASYSAQYYQLAALTGFPATMLEVGRFCVDPSVRDPDLLRAALAALTALAQTSGARMLFGCASFPGTDWRAYGDAFATLAARHLAPPRWRPGRAAAQVVPYADLLRGRVADPLRAARQLPPLLRSYLAMGGWVSDHAVIDHDLNTLHVFTALDVAAIPLPRVQVLRRLVRAAGTGALGPAGDGTGAGQKPAPLSAGAA